MQLELTRPLAGLLVALAACSGEDPPNPIEAPCPEPHVVVTDDTSLAAALESATAGTCIVMREGTYQGPLVVDTEGVTIAAADGETVVVRGSAGGVAIRVTADGVTVIGVDTEGGDYGLALIARRGTFRAMELAAAGEAAVGIRCEDQDCLDVAERTELLDLVLRDSQNGAVIYGASVLIDGADIRNHSSTQLTGGGGIYALDGADVLVRSSMIQGNTYGLVGDGAATRLAIEGGTIADNDQGGVRAQDMTAATGAALTMSGGVMVARNGIFGVGTIGVTGVLLDDVTIQDSILKPVSGNGMMTFDVGDGLGLFDGTTNASIRSTTLDGNARAQAVVDDAGVAITLHGSVTASGGMHSVVIQNTPNNMVAVPMNLVTNLPNPLFVTDDRIAAPGMP